MKRLACIGLLVVGGCATDPQDFNRAPHMTPVGSGLTAYADPAITQFPGGFKGPSPTNTLWGDRSDLFRDPRAAKVGDLLTVTISINDSAQLGNSSDRSRESQVKSSLDYLIGMLGVSAKGTGNYTVDASSTNKGVGNINRSEKINLSVAAVVTKVFPNGNMLISGSQEIRVNYELRALEIVGIVRPRDINRDNTIPYDKIAEARVSYGGRGRLTEVQQPAWGQQLHDNISPF